MIRDPFKPQIDPEIQAGSSGTGKAERIMEAASRASTTGNMQVYSIVVTSDEEIKRQLWESHFVRIWCCRLLFTLPFVLILTVLPNGAAQRCRSRV
jgi:nitroreductase